MRKLYNYSARFMEGVRHSNVNEAKPQPVKFLGLCFRNSAKPHRRKNLNLPPDYLKPEVGLVNSYVRIRAIV